MNLFLVLIACLLSFTALVSTGAYLDRMAEYRYYNDWDAVVRERTHMRIFIAASIVMWGIAILC